MEEWINIPENIDDYFGFVYIIRNKINNRYYIGKKFYWRIDKLPQLKGRTNLEREKRKNLKGNKRHIKKETDWRDYWGSSKELLEDIEKHGKENFSRTILQSYKTKWECAYYEVVEQINNRVIFDNNSYNGIVNCRLCKAPKELRK
jgi:hypothetical protein